MLAAIERSPTLLKEDTHLEDALGATSIFATTKGTKAPRWDAYHCTFLIQLHIVITWLQTPLTTLRTKLFSAAIARSERSADLFS